MEFTLFAGISVCLDGSVEHVVRETDSAVSGSVIRREGLIQWCHSVLGQCDSSLGPGVHVWPFEVSAASVV